MTIQNNEQIMTSSYFPFTLNNAIDVATNSFMCVGISASSNEDWNITTSGNITLIDTNKAFTVGAIFKVLGAGTITLE